MLSPSADSYEPLELAYAGLITALRARGAGDWEHPGGTLLAHLLRTARRLETWGASRELITAGLCHAAYGTAGYPRPLLALSDRARLREDIGDEAEAIVYAYCALDRDVRERELRDRFSGEYWTASVRMQRQLAELTVANELDVIEHAALGADSYAAIAAMIAAAGPDVSRAAWSAVLANPQLRERLPPAAAASGDAEIAQRELGRTGERILLWHGGGGAELTWSRQHPLATQFRLQIPWRRGFTPSAPAQRQDWGADVRDLLRVMPDGAHVVAHSYGGVSALIAAALAPERFASLVIIEAPLHAFGGQDAELQQLVALGRAFASGAPEAREAFLSLAGLPLDHPQTKRTERLARDFRDPSDAKPDLSQLRAAQLRAAVVSGGHNGAIERLCDGLARELGAQRWSLAGAGHAVPRQAQFNGRLADFVLGL
jgi:pimeloyl-ACP methyl ester carboxylesterase